MKHFSSAVLYTTGPIRVCVYFICYHQQKKKKWLNYASVEAFHSVVFDLRPPSFVANLRFLVYSN